MDHESKVTSASSPMTQLLSDDMIFRHDFGMRQLSNRFGREEGLTELETRLA